jgi:hypothetical protein
LLTRIGPNDRPVPKPAFELTQKKLDASKSGAIGVKKTVPKTKWKKTTARVSKATAGTKKAASTGKADGAVTAKSVAAPKSSSPAGHELAARQAVDAKKTSAKPAAKSSGSGQKPSPAIAKSQTSQESD